MQRPLLTFHKQTDKQLGSKERLPSKKPNLPSIFVADHDVIWHGICLWSVWVTCPGYALSQLLMLPQPTCWGGRIGKREGPDTIQTRSSIATTLVCHHHCFSHKCKTQHHLGENELHPSQAQYNMFTLVSVLPIFNP